MPLYPHIGAVLLARREQLGLTQRDLAIRLGWAHNRQGDISRVERGQVDPTVGSLLCFAQALDCSAAELVASIATAPQESAPEDQSGAEENSMTIVAGPA